MKKKDRELIKCPCCGYKFVPDDPKRKPSAVIGVACSQCNEFFAMDELNWQELGHEDEPLCGVCAVQLTS